MNYGILMRSGSRDSYVAGIQGYASRNHHEASMNVGSLRTAVLPNDGDRTSLTTTIPSTCTPSDTMLAVQCRETSQNQAVRRDSAPRALVTVDCCLFFPLG